MSEDRFDQDIRKILEESQETYDGQSWEVLSKKLDSVDAVTDEELQDIVVDKLSNHKEPVIESHWQKLKTELEELEKRRYRLWAIKLSEVVIVLLLLLTYFNYNNLSQKVKIDTSEGSVLQYADNADGFIKSSTEKGAPDKIEGLSIIEVDKSSKIGTLQNIIVDALPRLNFGLVKIEKNVHEIVDHVTSSIPSIPNKPIRELIIPTRFITPLSYVVHLEEHSDYLHKNDGLWLSLDFSQDINLVNSGLNFGYIKSQVNSGLSGQSVGMSLSYQKKNVEFTGGLGYSHKSYAPGLLRGFTKASLDTYLETQIDQIRFKQLHIPVTLKVHGLNRTNSNLYAVAGIGANIIMDYNYSLEKSVQPTARVASLVDNSDIDITELPLGTGEGGSIHDNAYFTAILGFGMQANLKNNSAFFIQPQYQFNFSGGLNQYVQKVHSINIQAGLKFKF